MEGISCDRCGDGLLIDDDVRYVMGIEITAAYDPMEITQEDLEGDLDAEIAQTIKDLEAADPEEMQRQVHYRERFDLCPRCRKAVMEDPLFRRESRDR